MVRKVLKALAKSSPGVTSHLEKCFTLPIARDNNKKRKAFETCVNCRAQYTVSRNPEGCCVYHPGKHIGRLYLGGSRLAVADMFEGNKDGNTEHPLWRESDKVWDDVNEEDYPEAFT